MWYNPRSEMKKREEDAERELRRNEGEWAVLAATASDPWQAHAGGGGGGDGAAREAAEYWRRVDAGAAPAYSLPEIFRFYDPLWASGQGRGGGGRAGAGGDGDAGGPRGGFRDRWAQYVDLHRPRLLSLKVPPRPTPRGGGRAPPGAAPEGPAP